MKLKEIILGRRVKVNRYNASIMNKPTFKTTIDKSVQQDFFTWAKQQKVSSSCPKDVGLNYTV